MIGIHDISNADYHAVPGVSKTTLWRLYDGTPAHARFHVRVDKPEFNLGTAFHTAALEPEKFEATVLRGPEARGNSNVWKDAALHAESVGAILLKPADHDIVQRMRDSAWRNAKFQAAMRGAEIERSAFSLDEETGVLVRCRPDIANRGLRVLADLKSTRSAAVRKFASDVASYGYHMQDQLYSKVWEAAGGGPVEGFIFFAIESEPPYLFAAHELDAASAAEGHAAYRAALVTYAACHAAEASGVPATEAWPGYPDSDEPISLPRWAYKLTDPNDAG